MPKPPGILKSALLGPHRHPSRRLCDGFAGPKNRGGNSAGPPAGRLTVSEKEKQADGFWKVVVDISAPEVGSTPKP
jgi:hypothetical protein